MSGERLDAELEPDGKLVLVGNLTEEDGRIRNLSARLTQEGVLEPSINLELNGGIQVAIL